MKRALSYIVALLALCCCCSRTESVPLKQMTVIAPGHFHAALTQKTPLPGVGDTVHVFAPEGVELQTYLKTVASYTDPETGSSRWVEKVYAGEDYLEKVPPAQSGCFVVLAGNNKLKSRYILESVRKGYHVLADKPMAISREDLLLLDTAYHEASERGLVICEMMTERYDLLNKIVRELVADQELFGVCQRVKMLSVHHFYKEVSGVPVRRPAWYFDVTQQGEGIADVTTHLIDQIFWICSPAAPVTADRVVLKEASRWTTPLSMEQFRQVTGESVIPSFLADYVRGDSLEVSANGRMSFMLDQIPCDIEVHWDYVAPEGAGDISVCRYTGSRATLEIVQDAETGFVRQLFLTAPYAEAASAVARLKADFPFVHLQDDGEGRFLLDVPLKERSGHEEHFGLVARAFLHQVDEALMSDEESANTLTKYKLTIDAVSAATMR